MEIEHAEHHSLDRSGARRGSDDAHRGGEAGRPAGGAREADALVGDLAAERIRLLGLAEMAGAVGLVAPQATGIAPLLTPLAALCLAALMAGAVRTHRGLREGFAPAAIVGALCVGIAAGRLVLGAQV